MSVTKCVELGFIEEVDSWKLKSKYFPCKVGGYPAWLNLENLPYEEKLSCKKCLKPLVFLCQMYAPFPSKEDCFHRAIFVFICRDGSCSSENDAANIKVFRSQLPRDNRFYSYEPSKFKKDGSDSPSASEYVKICAVCGCKGQKKCGACKLINYCSADHQARDWKSGHKLDCKNKEVKNENGASKTFLFPEYEIEIEAEDIESEVEKTEEQVVAEYEDLLKRGQIPSNNSVEDNEQCEKDLIKAAAVETDIQFATFRTKIKLDPTQIMRYDREGEPLWVSSENKVTDVPNCERCGATRQFELQLMPQLLVHLKVDNLQKETIDWGTIMVYSCSQSCSIGDEYAEEIAYKQDYSPDTDFLRT